MTDTPKTASDATVTEPPIAPIPTLKEPSDDRPLPVGDAEVTGRVLSGRPRTAPAPVKI